MSFRISLKEAEKIVQKLQKSKLISRKIEILKKGFIDFHERQYLSKKLEVLDINEFGQYIAWGCHLFGQTHIVSFLLNKDKKFFLKKMLLIDSLKKLEIFYCSQGGYLAYLVEFQKHLQEEKKYNFLDFSLVSCLNVNSCSFKEISSNVFFGIKSLLETGFFILAGGCAERFFQMKKKRSLSSLPFFNKTLLERAIADIEGLEALYKTFYHRSITIPITIMVSSSVSLEDDCFTKIKKMSRYLKGFLKILVQSDFPAVSSEGFFVLNEHQELIMLPGGHGMLWKDAYSQGIFHFFKELGVKYILIRQINNPLAGLDKNILLLLGISSIKHKRFGVISCTREAGYSEGVWVKLRNNDTYSHVNIEYVEFPFVKKDLLEQSPSNTNILFFDLEKNWNLLSNLPNFDSIINMKTFISNGINNILLSGRLEYLVQDFTKLFRDKRRDRSSVIILHFPRKKVLSSIKQILRKDCHIETPERAFFDYLSCSRELLELCKVNLPKKSSWEEFLNFGPEFVFDYHPSLGPLYSIIKKKIYGGSFFRGSIIELNLQDLIFKNVNIDGHFILQGDSSGGCFMQNIEIQNKGSIFINPRESWKRNLCTREKLIITLNKESKIYADNIVLKGNIEIDVPRGESWRLFMNNKKELDYRILSRKLEFIL